MNTKDENQKLTKIVLLGVSCVGKTTLGRIIPEKLGYKFVESDQELIEIYGSILKFQREYFTLTSRMKQKAIIFSNILTRSNNIVLDVSPMFNKTAIKKTVSGKNILPIYLYDTPENIFKRITFTDDNDQLIEMDPEYLEKKQRALYQRY